VWVGSDRDKNESAATNKAFLYTLTLTSYGMSRATLEQLIAEAQKAYQQQTARKAGVWVSRYEDEWTEDRNLAIRPLSTLVFDAETIARVIGDAKRFLERRERYMQLGIPFRRGYLLYGPPGTGKTSLAMALAHELQRELCMLPLSRPLLDDQLLGALMSALPENALVLIEDVDAIFRRRENQAGNNVTFSGFLNALDGALAQHGQIVVMTTNHIETLDPALLRPGRIDVQVPVVQATHYQAMELYRRFFPGHAAHAESFAKQTTGWTMAQLQECLVRHMDDPAGAASPSVLVDAA
jgi:chaperone BCS1